MDKIHWFLIDKMPWFLLIVIISIFSVVLVNKRLDAQGDMRMLMADREYWRMVASYPEVACRKRGGVYTVKGFTTTFGRTSDQIHYDCNQIKQEEWE